MNSSKKLIKQAQKAAEKELEKQYNNEKYKILIAFIPAFAYGLIFILKSFIDKSATFSFELATLSLFITVSFEIKEWCTYFNKVGRISKKVLKIINYFPTILNGISLFVLFIFFCNILGMFIKISILENPIYPNFITALSLFIYFFSYTLRELKTKHYEYSKGKNL